MKTSIVRYWPIAEPIPKGWRAVSQRASHHMLHSILIERVERPKRPSSTPIRNTARALTGGM